MTESKKQQLQESLHNLISELNELDTLDVFVGSIPKLIRIHIVDAFKPKQVDVKFFDSLVDLTKPVLKKFDGPYLLPQQSETKPPPFWKTPKPDLYLQTIRLAFQEGGTYEFINKEKLDYDIQMFVATKLGEFGSACANMLLQSLSACVHKHLKCYIHSIPTFILPEEDHKWKNILIANSDNKYTIHLAGMVQIDYVFY